MRRTRAGRPRVAAVLSGLVVLAAAVLGFFGVV
jgi:hypothetical protein